MNSEDTKIFPFSSSALSQKWGPIRHLFLVAGTIGCGTRLVATIARCMTSGIWCVNPDGIGCRTLSFPSSIYRRSRRRNAIFRRPTPSSTWIWTKSGSGPTPTSWSPRSTTARTKEDRKLGCLLQFWRQIHGQIHVLIRQALRTLKDHARCNLAETRICIRVSVHPHLINTKTGEDCKYSCKLQFCKNLGKSLFDHYGSVKDHASCNPANSHFPVESPFNARNNNYCDSLFSYLLYDKAKWISM